MKLFLAENVLESGLKDFSLKTTIWLADEYIYDCALTWRRRENQSGRFKVRLTPRTVHFVYNRRLYLEME